MPRIISMMISWTARQRTRNFIIMYVSQTTLHQCPWLPSLWLNWKQSRQVHTVIQVVHSSALTRKPNTAWSPKPSCDLSFVAKKSSQIKGLWNLGKMSGVLAYYPTAAVSIACSAPATWGLTVTLARNLFTHVIVLLWPCGSGHLQSVVLPEEFTFACFAPSRFALCPRSTREWNQKVPVSLCDIFPFPWQTGGLVERARNMAC